MNDSMANENKTVIVGAGPAGLAVAACLKRNGLPYILLEASNRIGTSWSRHYDRLHLHTTKRASHLPFLPFPKEADKYISRDAVVEYLRYYCDHFELDPKLGEKVIRINKENGHWITETTKDTYVAENVIIATGTNHIPNIPRWEGMENFKGRILHSSEYKNGSQFSYRNVLVVGFGNSACEQAICLYEHGAVVSMSVRSPVNIIPRDLFGINSSDIGSALAFIPPYIADTISAPIRKARYGDMEEYGLEIAPFGPITQVLKKSRIPMIDIGTVDLIRAGAIKIFPEIDRFEENSIVFSDGRKESFDAVVLGTGYKHKIHDIVQVEEKGLYNEKGFPAQSGTESVVRGLYFCGFWVSPNGMLRQIRRESKRIAAEIKRKT